MFHKPFPSLCLCGANFPQLCSLKIERLESNYFKTRHDLELVREDFNQYRSLYDMQMQSDHTEKDNQTKAFKAALKKLVDQQNEMCKPMNSENNLRTKINELQLKEAEMQSLLDNANEENGLLAEKQSILIADHNSDMEVRLVIFTDNVYIYLKPIFKIVK